MHQSNLAMDKATPKLHSIMPSSYDMLDTLNVNELPLPLSPMFMRLAICSVQL